VAELFAGVGGFRIGLARAGWKTTFSNQWEPSTKVQHASDVYVAQFGEQGHTNVDIAKIKALPKNIDLLVGGFPCQDYSVAKTLNSSKGLKGKKGVLWWEILRLVHGQKPKFIFLENVDRLLKSPSNQRGRDFAVMLKTLGDEGYAIEWRVVNAAEYGFPQRRIRVFIVATKLKKGAKKASPETVISKTGILARALPIEKFTENMHEIDLSADADELSSKFNKGKEKSPFLNSGCFMDGIAYTIKSQAKLAAKPIVLGDVLQPDSQVPDEYWVEEKRLKEWQYLKGAKSIERTHKGSGVTYNYAEGKMAFPDLLTNPSRTILTGEGGTTPSRFKHIIKRKNGYRRLTPIELERLNGFPDNWSQVIAGGKDITDAKRAFFMGNALVIGLIEKVGKVIAYDLRSS
jgi:DNA (cytosine-5)-methyltransferase 1